MISNHSKDITGKVFGRLTVLSLAGKNNHRVLMWNCICSCGKKTITCGTSLRSGNSKSCGCLRLENTINANTTHGKSKTNLYKVWTSMICRCYVKTDANYSSYGGRGITVCDSWKTNYQNFLDDMGEPAIGATIDRIDNDKGYYLENCRWATRVQQQRNIRSNVNITFNGKTQCITAWANEIGVKVGTLQSRLVRYKWPIEKALKRPVQDWGR
jgi:hypothetical protein